ncbi:MAG TPA: hypothetical protein VNQ90_07230 [Chthoniobacteraceae bacterium]|nr:hypothetical protein [Chthoniobacteraceae bacterium]
MKPTLLPPWPLIRLIACLLPFLLGALRPEQAGGATILTLDDLVRPGGSGDANTFLVGTDNTPATTATLTSDPGSLTFVSKAGILVVQFANVSLANVGQSITLTYTVTLSNFDNGSRGLRLGLFHHDTGSLLSADITGVSSGFTGYQGYVETRRVTSTNANSSEFARRDPTRGALMDLTGAPILGNPTGGLNAVNGQTYQGSLTLERTGVSEITFTHQFGNDIQIYTDTGASMLTAFDTVAFRTDRADATVATSMVFTSFTLTQTIPEPGAAWLLLPALGLLAWPLRLKKVS